MKMSTTANMAYPSRSTAMNAERITTEMLKETEKHHSDLNIFAAVASVLDGGFIYTESGRRMAGRIIKLCRQEEQTQLRAYDKATATAAAKATTAA